jgi:hypothetical protein
VAHALSLFTSVRYGRIASVSVTHDATKFVGPHKYCMRWYIIKRLFIWTQSTRALIDTGGGYHIQIFEFMIQTTLNLPIQYSPLSPNCPARSQVMPTSRSIHLYHIGPPSIENALSRADSNHSSSTDSLHN